MKRILGLIMLTFPYFFLATQVNDTYMGVLLAVWAIACIALIL